MHEQQQQIQDDLYRRKQEEWYRLQQQQKQLVIPRGGQTEMIPQGSQTAQNPAIQKDFVISPTARTRQIVGVRPTVRTIPVARPYGGQTFPKVQRIVAEQLGLLREQIQPNSNIALELGADSLAVAQLIGAVEKEFGLSIPDGVVKYLRTRVMT
jgi:acyl carrier protein